MKNRFTRLIMAALLLTIMLLSVPLEASADANVPSAQELWKRMNDLNPSLQDYSVALKVQVKGKYHFLKPNIRITGNYFYKKPDKHKLKLNKASYFLDKYPKIFGWNLPSLDDNNAAVRKVTSKGHNYYVATLTPKKDVSDVKSIEMWIDAENSTLPYQIYNYKGDGKIVLKVNFREYEGYLLYDTMEATFSFPKENLSAEAKAKYGAYKLNPGLSDSFFDE